MARLEVTGLHDLMITYSQTESGLRPMIEEALKMSGEALKEELLAQEQRFKDPTGELGETIALSEVGHAQSASMIDQYYKGGYTGRRKGGEKAGEHAPRRAGFVAAMQENRNKNPFNKRAKKRAEPRINSIIAELLGGL